MYVRKLPEIPGGGSLAAILQRAKSRLEEARGGTLHIREGLRAKLFDPPVIISSPKDMNEPRGKTVKLRVKAEVITEQLDSDKLCLRIG